MPSVGSLLRKARLDQGVTLQDISVRTRIALHKLEAIESDDLGELSSPFIYRSFVRQFAGQLELDYESVEPDVLTACAGMSQPLLPGEGNAPVVRVPPIRPRAKHDFHWMYAALGLVLVVAAGSGALKLWSRANPTSSLASLPSALASHLGVGGSKARVPAITNNKLATAAPPSAPAVAPPASEVERGIHIQLSAIETTWLLIVADGKQTYSGLLEASQTKILDGRQTARIRTGNAGGVTIVFNGKELGPMGRRGEARTVLFTTTGYEVVRSAAEALIPALFVSKQ